MFVAFAAVLSLVASSVRASDALLGVTFARACAAEAATTHPSQIRVGRALSLDDDDEPRSNDIDTFAPTLEITKASSAPRQNDRSAAHRIASLSPSIIAMLPSEHAVDTGLSWPPPEPSSRARARLMVFLN
jgi:hypothetical protein